MLWSEAIKKEEVAMPPRTIIVMRHGESEEDIDKSVYAHTADLDIALSLSGEDQSCKAGPKLLELTGMGDVHFYLSPGLRLRQTYDLMSSRFPDGIKHSFSVETLMLKQFWGDVTVDNRREIEIARYKEGVLVYRFPNGESGPQLVERFKFFANNLRIEFAKEDFPEHVVILTHGFEARVFLMVWLGWSVEYFERLANLKNCEMIAMRLNSNGSYSLDHEMRLYDKDANPDHVPRC